MVRLLESIETEKRAELDKKLAEDARGKQEKEELEKLYVPTEKPVKISVKTAPKKQNFILKKSDLFDE